MNTPSPIIRVKSRAVTKPEAVLWFLLTGIFSVAMTLTLIIIILFILVFTTPDEWGEGNCYSRVTWEILTVIGCSFSSWRASCCHWAILGRWSCLLGHIFLFIFLTYIYELEKVDILFYISVLASAFIFGALGDRCREKGRERLLSARLPNVRRLRRHEGSLRGAS